MSLEHSVGQEAEQAESGLPNLPHLSSTPMRSFYSAADGPDSEAQITTDGSTESESDLISAPEGADDSCLGPNARFMTGGSNRRIEDTLEEEASSDDSFRTAADQSTDVMDFLVDVFKYVNDTTVVEAVDLNDAKIHLSTMTPEATSKSRFTEAIAGAAEIGMKVNCQKTQLLLISPPNGFNNNAYISIQGQKISSGQKLKLLGFVFGNEPNVSEHVAEIKLKFRTRFWSLIHLRNSGFKGDELF